MPEIKEIWDRRERDMSYKGNSPLLMADGKPIDLSRLVCVHSHFFDIDDANRYKEPEKQEHGLHTQAALFAIKYDYAYYRIAASERLFADAGGLMVFDRYYLNFYKEKV